MPLVAVLPNFADAEQRLTDQAHDVQDAVKAKIMEISEFPDYDVLVNIARCPWILADPLSTDLTLIGQTCPGELEIYANQIVEQVALVLADLGFSVGPGSEAWLQFAQGSWVKVVDGKIVDSVAHEIPGVIPFTFAK